jgi:hypothetical protein
MSVAACVMSGFTNGDCGKKELQRILQAQALAAASV